VDYIEGCANLPNVMNGFGFGEGTFRLHNISQGIARNIIHHNKGQTPFLEKVEHAHDVGMLAAGYTTGFSDKLLLKLGEVCMAAQIFVQNFDDHRLVKVGMVCPIGDAKATLTQDSLNDVFAVLQNCSSRQVHRYLLPIFPIMLAPCDESLTLN
jgi:hypothetical protein